MAHSSEKMHELHDKFAKQLTATLDRVAEDNIPTDAAFE